MGAYSRAYYKNFAKLPRLNDAHYKAPSEELTPLEAIHISWAIYFVSIGPALSALLFLKEISWEKNVAKKRRFKIQKLSHKSRKIQVMPY